MTLCLCCWSHFYSSQDTIDRWNLHSNRCDSIPFPLHCRKNLINASPYVGISKSILSTPSRLRVWMTINQFFFRNYSTTHVTGPSHCYRNVPTCHRNRGMASHICANWSTIQNTLSFWIHRTHGMFDAPWSHYRLYNEIQWIESVSSKLRPSYKCGLVAVVEDDPGGVHKYGRCISLLELSLSSDWRQKNQIMKSFW